MKTVIIASYAPSILNFRSQLVTSLCQLGEVIILAPWENQETANRIVALGAKYQPIQLSRQGINPLQDIHSKRELFKALKTISPDHVLSYTIKPIIWGSMAAKKSGVKHIHSMITGLGYAFIENNGVKQKLIHKIVKRLYKKALKHNKTVFFQNPDDMQLFKNLKLLPKMGNTQLINGSGVCLDHYYHHEPEHTTVRFLMISRLLKDKGVEEYLAAAKMLKAQHKDAECHLIGYLDNNPSCIEQHELDKAIKNGEIIFHGKQEDVRPIIATTNVYVLPSYREGTPRSVLEAMSMGRPVITTDAPGCRETVNNGKNGYLVPVRDAQALYDAMKKFVDFPNKIKEMGSHSRRLAEEKYDVKKVNQVILASMGVVE